jgi:hypothetical protein
MVGLPCLVSNYSKMHVAGWTWAVFLHAFSGEVYYFCSVSPGIFWIHPRVLLNGFVGSCIVDGKLRIMEPINAMRVRGFFPPLADYSCILRP